jgi:hypothetical protein
MSRDKSKLGEPYTVRSLLMHPVRSGYHHCAATVTHLRYLRVHARTTCACADASLLLLDVDATGTMPHVMGLGCVRCPEIGER